jgi:hypothetical protein
VGGAAAAGLSRAAEGQPGTGEGRVPPAEPPSAIHPVDYESDNAYYRVEGQCDLSALALSTWAKSDAPAGALLGRLRADAVVDFGARRPDGKA